MAEGFARHLYSQAYRVDSAGLKPSRVHPKAVEVMKEVGIDISHQRSKSVEEFTGQSFDVVITVCDSAKETCPVFPGKNKILHWSFKDPASVSGGEEEVLAVFRRVRDQIHGKVRRMADEFGL